MHWKVTSLRAPCVKHLFTLRAVVKSFDSMRHVCHGMACFGCADESWTLFIIEWHSYHRSLLPQNAASSAISEEIGANVQRDNVNSKSRSTCRTTKLVSRKYSFNSAWLFCEAYPLGVWLTQDWDSIAGQ